MNKHTAGFSLLTLGLALSCLSAAGAEARDEFILRSPDKSIEVTVKTGAALTYAVRVDGQAVLRPSRLGLEFADGTVLGAGARVARAEHLSVNSTWENRWGKRRQVHDRHNELRLVLRQGEGEGRSFEVVFRAFDDGVGLRYVLPGAQPETLVLKREQTEFAFAEDYTCFAGQQDGGFHGPQEWNFREGRLGAFKPESIVGLPLLIKTPTAWLAVLEADLLDWSGMWLAGAPGSGVTLTAKLAPRLDGRGLVKFTTPHASPWRVLMVGRQAGRLIESDLVSNLSTPCEIADTSWIKPGMMAWDHWWSGDVRMDTATLKQYIQLAADMGWPYQLIDWQWYGAFNTPQTDITHVNPAVDMGEVRRFAKEKHVKLWVWLHSNDVDRHGDYLKAFPLYEQWGMAGVKIDFMDSDHQEMVCWYEKITRAAAANHLMVNFHGAFKTSGFNRTWPNQITREGVLGNEYNRWSTSVTPEHKLMLPFTRYLSGPADFTPGGFLNRQPGKFTPNGSCTTVQGTRAAELALFVAYDSPLCCVCDHPDHYRDQPGIDFLKIVPTVWDDTRVLDGEPGKHLVMARRSGNQWFLGGLADRNTRELTFDLGFLGKGNWQLELWKDAPDSAQEAEHLAKEKRAVAAKDKLVIPTAPCGGFVGVLRKR